MATNRMDMKSRVLMIAMLIGIVCSIGLTYYHDIYRQDYVTFTDPDTVPDSSDVFSYVMSLFQQ